MARDFESKDPCTPIHHSQRFEIALAEIRKQKQDGRCVLDTRSQNRTPVSVLKSLAGAGYGIKHSGHNWKIV